MNNFNSYNIIRMFSQLAIRTDNIIIVEDKLIRWKNPMGWVNELRTSIYSFDANEQNLKPETGVKDYNPLWIITLNHTHQTWYVVETRLSISGWVSGIVCGASLRDTTVNNDYNLRYNSLDTFETVWTWFPLIIISYWYEGCSFICHIHTECSCDVF